MELDQLRHFLSVADTGNFTRAAEAVGLSQPALSRSIARLEEELGQPLLERQTRQTSLTEAGRRFRPRAQQILALVDEAKAEINDDGETGEIRLAAIPTIAPYYLPELLSRFQRQRPRARLIVSEDTTDRLLKRLADGAIDAAILARPIDAKYLQLNDLFDDELLLVMNSSHPLAEKRQIRASDIESLPFVLLGEAHCLTDNVLSFCRQKSFHPVSVEQTSQLATVQELVALGHGVSLVPAMARRLDTGRRRVYRSLAGDKPSRRIVLATNPYRFQSRLLREFVQTTLDFGIGGGSLPAGR